jgi:NADH-quinone oxidoreductase subunit J
MVLFALNPTQLAGAQIALAAALVIAGFVLLLPRPRGRSITGGIAALVASVSVFGAWLHTAYGDPMPDRIGSVLFAFFSLGALVFGTVLVVQRNPARGAIAFAFVILSTCGLFLLLAAPFLMAVTIIIYAGAIIVTFLFVLMLSQVQGPSDENDRSREPLFGSLAGFAFAGLVLFTIYLTALGNNHAKAESGTPNVSQHLPAPVLTDDERRQLADIARRLREAEEGFGGDLSTGWTERVALLDALEKDLEAIVGHRRKGDPDRVTPRDQHYEEIVGTIWARLQFRARLDSTDPPAGPRAGETRIIGDGQAVVVLDRVRRLRKMSEETFRKIERAVLFPKDKPDVAAGQQAVRELRDEVLLLQGEGELPSRNVANLGYLLYSQHLLAIELAGTLLLVATIGAVAIAQRKGGAQ